MSRSLRTLSILTRPSTFLRPLTRSQSSILRHTGDIKIQRVRFKSDFPRQAKRFFFQLAIGSAVVYSILEYITVEVEETGHSSSALSKTQPDARTEADDEAQDKVDGDGSQVPEDMPEDALFIPLGKVRQMPPTYYKGSDPEWQSFMELFRDHERLKAVHKELVDLVHSFCSNTKGFQTRIGVPMRLEGVWLHNLMPQGPPLEYEQFGLEITDDYIAWTSRPVSAIKVARLSSALMPLPVAKSLLASCSTYSSLQLARLKGFFNVSPASSDASPQSSVGTMTIEQIRAHRSAKESQNGAQMDKMSDPKSDVGSTKDSTKPASSDVSKIYGALPPLPQPHSDIRPAVNEFKRTLAKNWQPPSAEMERGTLVICGDIELHGPTGSCVLEVVADYHPRDAEYKTVRIGVKYLAASRARHELGPQSSHP